MSSRYNATVKILICLLCFNVLLVGTNHVFCLELSTAGIHKVHLQLYECGYQSNGETGKLQHQHNNKTSHAALLDLAGASPSCPECIDEHIQFAGAAAGVDISPAALTSAILPISQNQTLQNLLSSTIYSFHRQKHIPLSSQRLTAIRSTVLLI